MVRKTRLSGLGIFRLGMTPQQEKLWETFLFLAKVLILSLPLYFVILFGVSLAPLQQLDAFVSSGILRALGYPVIQDSAMVSVQGANPFSFFMSEDCTAWKSVLFLFALIFAVPKVPLRKRLYGLALGIPVLWLGNQARIVGVVITEQATSVQFAMLTHDYFWRVFLVALVLAVWFLWMKYAPDKVTSPRKRRIRPKLITRKTKRKA
jgi:exosortase/archaeosortase family protein